MSDESGKVFAGLANRNVFVWHNLTFELLQTITESNCAYTLSEPNPRPDEILSAIAFSPTIAKLFVAGNRISEWSLQRCTINLDSHYTTATAFLRTINCYLIQGPDGRGRHFICGLGRHLLCAIQCNVPASDRCENIGPSSNISCHGEMAVVVN